MVKHIQTIRQFHQSHNIPSSVQRKYIQNRTQTFNLKKAFQRKSISKATLIWKEYFETKLTFSSLHLPFCFNLGARAEKCIASMVELGFAFSISDIGELLESFALHIGMENTKARLKYRGRKDHPGPDWFKLFMNRNNLSLKETTKLFVARYNATKNPFIVYHFYDFWSKPLRI